MLGLDKSLILNLLEKTSNIDIIEGVTGVFTDNISIFYDIKGGLFLIDQHKNCVPVGLEDTRLYRMLASDTNFIYEGNIHRVSAEEYLQFQNKLIEDDEDSSLWSDSSWEKDEQFYVLYDTINDMCVTIAHGKYNKIISKLNIPKYIIWHIQIEQVSI